MTSTVVQPTRCWMVQWYSISTCRCIYRGKTFTVARLAWVIC